MSNDAPTTPDPAAASVPTAWLWHEKRFSKVQVLHQWETGECLVVYAGTELVVSAQDLYTDSMETVDLIGRCEYFQRERQKLQQEVDRLRAGMVRFEMPAEEIP